MFSCSEYVEGVNISPNDFSSAPGELLVRQANLAVVALSEGNAARTGGIFTDQFTGSDRQYIPLNSYTTTAGDYDDIWNDIYSEGLAEARLAENDAKQKGEKLLEGVSQIMQAIILGEAASLWGDVPNAQATNIDVFANPEFDDQISVLESVQTLLDNAIVNVGDADVSAFGLPVFEDNGVKWGKVAHTLKARYYLIMKNYPIALSESLLGLSSPSENLLANHSDVQGAKNLFFQFEVEQRSGYLTVDESHLRKLLDKEGVSRILGTPGDSNRRTVYFSGTNINTSPTGYFGAAASFPIVSYYENKLIQAEAAQRTGGDALGPFNDVRLALSLEFGGQFPSTTSTGETLLKEILEEKYITLIGSLQVFSDVRRTNNLIGVPIKGTGNPSIPQRLLYPQAEINSNANFPGLVDLFEPTKVNE